MVPLLDEDPELPDASPAGLAPIPIAAGSNVRRRSMSRQSTYTIRGGTMDAFGPYDPPHAMAPSTFDDLMRAPRASPSAYGPSDVFAELDELNRFINSPSVSAAGFEAVYDPPRSMAWPSYETSPPLDGSYAHSPHLSLSPDSSAAPFFPFLGSPTPPPPLGPYPMYRSDSNVSSFSISSSSDGDGSWGAGVNPHDVSKSSSTSAPGTPAGGIGSGEPTLVYGRSAPAATGMGTWWAGVGSRSVDALADGLGGRMGIRTEDEEDEDEEGNEATVRAKERMREGIGSVFSGAPMAIAGGASALGPGGERLSTSLPVSTLSKARGARHAAAVASGSVTRPSRSSPRSSPMAQRASRSSSSSGAGGYVVARNLFGGIVDYSNLPTKRSRGRRPVESRDVGLADADEFMQQVPGGSAFDPTLNPEAAAVEFCQTTKTGKPKKIFVCRVTNCGKVFKRSEHLKRHVRSIHTDVKPFACPWPSCAKLFNRHDNLNQHLRVHRTSDEGGHVLAGLGVGSDGVLRRDDTGEAVDPESLGLRNVEIPA